MASHIFQYPQHIVNVINTKITQGASLRLIRDALKQDFSQEIEIPSLDALNRYRKQYLDKGKDIALNTDKEQIQRDFNIGLAELDKLLTQIRDRQELNYSNVSILQGLMGKCLLRMAELERTQANNRHVDKDIEKQLLDYIKETRNFVKTIVTLTANLAAQQAKMDDLVKKETKFILSTVSNIILQICPERYETFTNMFRAALTNEGRQLEDVIDNGDSDGEKFED